MKSLSRGVMVILAVLGLALSAGAQPVDLLTNGGFEAGDLTGWTTSGLGQAGCASDWWVNDTGEGGCAFFTPRPPVDGTYGVFTSFDATAPAVTYILAQTFTLPAAPTGAWAAGLRWQEYAQWDLLNWGATESRFLRIRILDGAAQELLLAWEEEFAAGTMGDFDWTEHRVVLSDLFAAHWGETLQLVIEAYVPEAQVGPANLGLDSIGVILDDTDTDADGIVDIADNCPTDANPGQEDADGDGAGDVCDVCPNDADDDIDGDLLCADVDPCPINPENDADGDGACEDVDNCLEVANPGQEDTNGDGVGDACSPVVDIEAITAVTGGFHAQVRLDSLEGRPLSGEVRIEEPVLSLSQIRFVWRSTDCSGGATAEFFLNGVSLGVAAGSNNTECVCNPTTGVDEYLVTDAGLLAGWNPAGLNFLRAEFAGDGNNVGWLTAEFNASGAPDVVFFARDYVGEMDVCANPFTAWGAFTTQAFSVGAERLVVAYVEEALPCPLDISALADGLYSLVVTGNDGSVPSPSTDSAAFSKNGEGFIEFNDLDDDDFCGGADNCQDVYNPDQADHNRDGAGDVCSPSVTIDSLTDVAPVFDAQVSLASLVSQPFAGEVRFFHAQPAPTQLRFVWNSTGCNADLGSMRFTLNGVELGTATATNNTDCTCVPASGFMELVVNDPTLLANWEPDELNLLGFEALGDQVVFGWVYLELDGSGAVDLGLLNGGTAGDPDICNAGMPSTPLQVAQPFLPEPVRAVWQRPAPASLRFVWQSTGCVAGETLEFFLDGLSLGTAPAANNTECVCLPSTPFSTFEVTDPALLAVWNPTWLNTFRVAGAVTSTPLAWLYVEIDNSGQPDLVLFDQPGGTVEPSIGEPDLCIAGNFQGAFDATVDTNQPVVFPYDGVLPCALPLDSLTAGDYLLLVTGNDGSVPQPEYDLAGFSYTDQTLLLINDPDLDAVCAGDNCPVRANPDQADADGDGRGDACDGCPLDPQNDADSDLVCGNVDNCPTVANPAQTDTDGDGAGDECDPCPLDPVDDTDGDGVCDSDDSCPLDANPGQTDRDGDGLGDVCDPCPLDPDDDADADGLCADEDNCPADANADQADADADGVGDACDSCAQDALNDTDGDGVCGAVDNCPNDSNADQADADDDGAGDACDPCPDDPVDDADRDGVCGDEDNCPTVANADQADEDGDGIGDACEEESSSGCGCGTTGAGSPALLLLPLGLGLLRRRRS